MAQFDFGMGGGARRGANVGIDLGGVADLFRRRPEEAANDEEFKKMLTTGAMRALAGEEPRELMEAQSYLMKRGWGPKSSEAYINNYVSLTRKAAGQREFGAILKENAPVPAQEITTPVEQPNLEQFGVSPTLQSFMRSRDEEEGDADTMTEYRPGQPEKPFTQSQLARLAGPEGFRDISKSTTFMEAPQRRAHIEAQTGDVQSQRKTRENIERHLEELSDQPIAEGLPSQRKIARFPSLAQLIPAREKVDPFEAERREDIVAGSALKRAQAGRLNELARELRDPNLTKEKLTTMRAGLLREKDMIEKGFKPDSPENVARLTDLNVLLDDSRRRLAGMIKREQGGGAPEMDALPDPAKAKGRTVRDTTTGKRYKSDGSKWIELQGAFDY